MQAFISVLWGGLLNILGSVIGRALVALGFAYATYTGFDVGINWLYQQIQANFSSFDSETLSFFGFLWVDKAIGLIFSSYTAALIVKMAGSTKLTKLVMKS